MTTHQPDPRRQALDNVIEAERLLLEAADICDEIHGEGFTTGALARVADSLTGIKEHLARSQR